MTSGNDAGHPEASVEEVRQGWHELKSRVGQLEAERSALEQENKQLRMLLERVIEHRQKSHGELVHLLSGLVSRLHINDVGLIVSKLVEHNTHVSEVCAALAKGTPEAGLPQPAVLKALEDTKRELQAALKPAVDELIRLDPPLETDMLRSLIDQPESFYSPQGGRANRCYLKGQVPRERIVREFGEEALVFFNDMTTDRKLNPRPKPKEIALAFKGDFEVLLDQKPELIPEKRKDLLLLYHKVQQSKSSSAEARSQKNAFLKLSFIIELRHYYEHQNTEAPEVAFAQRLPALIEQLTLPGSGAALDEKSILQAESLLALVLNPDHRVMIVNNVGKDGGEAKTLKYVLRLRGELSPEEQHEVIPEVVRHLIPMPPQKPPQAKVLAGILRLVNPDLQKPVIRTFMSCDRLRKKDAQALGKALGKELDLSGLDEEARKPASVPTETERQMAWDQIKGLMTGRTSPDAIAAAIRERLHAKYDIDEVRQSWITLTEVDAILLIRIVCRLPYRKDGKTDSLARPILESYVNRLMHEKYATTYTKVVNSLRNMFKARPDSPTLQNFVALVRWADSEAADRLSKDIGMAVPAR